MSTELVRKILQLSIEINEIVPRIEMASLLFHFAMVKEQSIIQRVKAVFVADLIKKSGVK